MIEFLDNKFVLTAFSAFAVSFCIWSIRRIHAEEYRKDMPEPANLPEPEPITVLDVIETPGRRVIARTQRSRP